MAGVFNGFAVIVALVALGWVLARSYVLGADARLVLNRLVFFVATPALLFDSLARTTLDQVFTGVFVVSAGSAMLIAAAYVLIARVWLKRPAADLVVGALSAGYVNSANLGIPIALYVLGDLGFVMPLLLFQVVVLQPIAIAVLERAARAGGGADTVDGGSSHESGGGALGSIIQAVRNPIVLAALAGVVVAALPWTPPDKLLEPVHLVGQISVPGALLVFGMSLYGVKVLEAGASPRREIALASILKLIAHPLLAYGIGGGLMGMQGHELLTVVVAAALPTAQNVLVVATRYGHGVLLARDSAVLTTLGALPVLLLISALLA
ncbi:AEC family transporter [Rhodococcus sp. IEGM 1408]|uniref:AEC family transporter n=1 Tax=Rhodococcus sp. IEGM 1408 TaxID=3082220 RepID=UPI00295324B4|nr:AEC family transporter [Rhodococcus sp. IEGM 1408]MDV8001132.1 AEC family transporter [Rhodococcus sp. IEGM 1408]